MPNEKARALGQSEEGRLHDVLWMLHMTIATDPSVSEILFYKVLVHDGQRQREVRLKAVCGPGDEGEPCLTVMYPDED